LVDLGLLFFIGGSFLQELETFTWDAPRQEPLLQFLTISGTSPVNLAGTASTAIQGVINSLFASASASLVGGLIPLPG